MNSRDVPLTASERSAIQAELVAFQPPWISPVALFVGSLASGALAFFTVQRPGPTGALGPLVFGVLSASLMGMFIFRMVNTVGEGVFYAQRRKAARGLLAKGTLTELSIRAHRVFSTESLDEDVGSALIEDEGGTLIYLNHLWIDEQQDALYESRPADTDFPIELPQNITIRWSPDTGEVHTIRGSGPSIAALPGASGLPCPDRIENQLVILDRASLTEDWNAVIGGAA